MSNELIKGLPYSDDFDPTKKFTQILALPGRVQQAREFTQSQTLIYHFMKRLANTILKDGRIVSGMGFRFGEGNSVIISAGEIYLDGIIHDFDSQTVTLTKTGTETIGILLEKSIVTEEQDTSLRDPAQGYANFSQLGAHRIKAVPTITLNDDTSITLYEFYDGELQSNVTVQSDMFSDLLAKRTYDESGNYKADGFSMWTRDYDATNLLLTVESGRAYVQGYEVYRPSPARIVIPKALSTRPVSNEPKTFQSGVNRYLINNKYVDSITSVVGSVETTGTVTRGSVSGGMDTLPKTPVVSVVSIVAGATTYIQGTDFQLSGDRIDWSLAGAEPGIGSTYTVVWRYNKNMVLDTDYVLTKEPSGDGYLDFAPAGDNPVVGSTILIDYNFLLSRFDRVYLDREGDIEITQGQSDLSDIVSPPVDSDPFRLSLGIYKLIPDSIDAEINGDSISRISMADIHSLVKRMDNMEYNQALSDLDQEAMTGESPTNLKGIFTDGFLGFSKSDTAHADFSAAIDISEHQLILSGTMEESKPVVNSALTTAKLFNGQTFTLSHTEQVVASQLVATNTMNVNPYNAFNKEGFLKISPERDGWIDASTIQLLTETVRTETLWGWWKSDVTSSVTTSTSIVDSAIAYARRIDIDIDAMDFPANTDLLEGFIDGVKVFLTPTGTTVAGTVAGTVKADSTGRVTAKFTIPANIRTGSREILLKNAVSQGSTLFTSSGIRRSITNNVHRTRTTYRTVDPLAQSFQLTEDRFVTGLDLYFSTKSATDSVYVQVRGVFNGYPTNEILAESMLLPSQVNVSTGATSATSVSFDTPAFCLKDTQYAIVVLTSSSQYNLHIATLGNKMTGSTAFATSQPYGAGVLFSSSNAVTWTAHQDSDLKFSIRGASFNPVSVIEFQTVSALDADLLVLDAKYETPPGTSVVWEYKLAGSFEWLPIDTLITRNLSKVSSTVTLRATLATTNPRVSPVISADDLLFVTSTTRSSSSYISKLVTTAQAYTTVRQIIEAYVPSGTMVVPKLSINDSTWVTGTLLSAETVDSQFTRYSYEYVIPSSGNSFEFRARVDLSTTNRIIKPIVSKIMNIIK